MKKFPVSFFALSMFIVFSFSIVQNSCNCNECDILELADLIVENISTVFSESDDDGDVYEIIHFSLNTIEGLACKNPECDDVKSAGPHGYSQNIYYSEDLTNEWGNPIDTCIFSNDTLPPCDEVENSNIIKFLLDGYYLIEGIVDSYNNVDERNETNNDLSTGIEKRISTDIRPSGVIIYVNRGLKQKTFEKDGKIKYIIRGDANTRYIDN